VLAGRQLFPGRIYLEDSILIWVVMPLVLYRHLLIANTNDDGSNNTVVAIARGVFGNRNDANDYGNITLVFTNNGRW
jgi:hypothetical protein